MAAMTKTLAPATAASLYGAFWCTADKSRYLNIVQAEVDATAGPRRGRAGRRRAAGPARHRP
jgi:hypothetical protein